MFHGAVFKISQLGWPKGYGEPGADNVGLVRHAGGNPGGLVSLEGRRFFFWSLKVCGGSGEC